MQLRKALQEINQNVQQQKLCSGSSQRITIEKEPELLDSLCDLRAVNHNHTRFLTKKSIAEGELLSIHDDEKNILASIRAKDYIYHVALSPNAAYVALGYYDHLKVYDITKNKPQEIAHSNNNSNGNGYSLLFLHDKELLIADYAGIQKWKFSQEKKPTDFIKHEGSKKKLCTINDTIIFTNFCGKEKPIIKITNYKGLIKKKLSGHTKNIDQLLSHAATHCFASVSEYERTVRIWDIKKDVENSCVAVIETPYEVDSAAFSPCGNYIAIGSSKDYHSIYVWGMDSQPIIKYTFNNDFPITFLSWAGYIIAQNGLGSVYRLNLDCSDLNNTLKDTAQEFNNKDKKAIL